MFLAPWDVASRLSANAEMQRERWLAPFYMSVVRRVGMRVDYLDYRLILDALPASSLKTQPCVLSGAVCRR